MVGVERVELPTPAMSTQCSTTELYAHTIEYAGTADPLTAGAPFSQGVSRTQDNVRAFAQSKACLDPIFEDALNFEHEIAQVERLGEDLCTRLFAACL